MFNFPQYLQSLHEHNKLAKSAGFQFGTCASEADLQGALANFRKATAYLIACDVATGGTVNVGASWAQRRQFTFFVLKKCEFGDREDQEAALNVCRELRRQLLSRFLADQEGMFGKDKFQMEIIDKNITMNLSDVRSTEFPDLHLNNCTGLYVMINVDEPISLEYNDAEWTE